METTALATLAMVGSAMAHAVMTLFTKKAKDTLVFRALTMVICAIALSPLAVILPFPDWEVWRFLLLSAVIIWAFNMFLIAAFQRGDMNLVYPVMRGAAPAMAGFFAFIFLQEALSPLAIIGLTIASAAIIAFAWPERNGTPKMTAIGFALCAALMTASYTVVDASGVRAAVNPLQYAVWFFILSAFTLSVTALVRRRGAIIMAARAELSGSLKSAVFNAATYSLALYAYSVAAVAPMAALRETSIVFGAILAAWVLREPFGLRRGVLALVLAGGLALLQLG
ncbi:MAG: EamA family transporter [Oceanicaulis sp.]|uniref:EamA family transporter n=1 Tax=Glycocaulis sp. TaxID=1969725 RepID=UPI0025B814D2|nr:EamA family transporter [Glycocaulis sp.]MCC5980995.1 EamA family transporter [Oceanicaulis sp.]MCH8522259.1 EamA family transporter [Glycocaulis sp.]